MSRTLLQHSMRITLGITSKLFLAVVAISIIVVWAMSSAVGVGFRRDFIEYTMKVENRRTELLLRELGRFYRDNGGWESLRANPELWEELINLETLRRRDRNDRRNGDGDDDHNDDDGDDRDGRDERRDRRDGDGRDGERRHGRDDGDDDHERYRDYPDFTGLRARLSLLDPERDYVAGNPETLPDAVVYPVLSAGDTVGWLAIAPAQDAIDAVDIQFQDQQLRTARIIGGASILLAGLIAWLLARVFISRLQRFARATHRLAAGDYGTRVSVASRDEFGELAEDFNTLARALEKNEQVRRSFMADMAHELRTPLAVLQAELAAIEDGVRQLTPDTIKSLQTEIRTLSKLIGDLYELSLSDTGALNYRKTEIDIVELLRTTLKGYRERFSDRRIGIETHLTDEPLLVLGDPHWLAQLFNNLLDNTLRYTDSGGRLEVSCSRSNDHVRIDFQDTAPGVPDEALPRVFERLFRVEPSRSRSYGGAGLGLAICKNIVEAHDGTISAQHSPLGGLGMTVTLPLVRS